MSALLRSRWVKIVFRIAGILVLVALIVATAVPLLVRIPAIHSFLESEISRRAQAEVTFRSASWFFRDRVKLSGVRVRQKIGDTPIDLAFQSVRVLDMLSPYPRIVLRNSEIATSENSIFSASGATLVWHEENGRSRVHIAIENALFDPLALRFLADMQTGTESNDTVDYAILESIDLSDLRVRIPGITHDYRWNGTVTVDPVRSRFDLRANGSSSVLKTDNRLDVNAQILAASSEIVSLQGSAKNFPLDLSPSFPFSTIIDGTFAVRPAGRNQYTGEIGYRLRDIALSLPAAASVTIPCVTVTSRASLSPRLIPQSVTAMVEHSAALYSTTDSVWPVPPGTLSLTFSPDDRDKPVNIDWNSDAIGNVSLLVSDWPFSATTASSIAFAISDKPLSNYTSYVRDSLPPWLDSTKGRLSLKGGASIAGTTVERYTAEGMLTGGSLRMEPIDISQASITVNLTGGGERVRADTHLRAAVSLLRSGTPVLQLEPEAEAIADYAFRTGDLTVVVPKALAGPVQSVSAWFKPDGRWAVEGDFSLEEGIPPLRDAFLPLILSGLEGMGQIHLSAQGQDTRLTALAESPDISVYSFADALSFGVQLRAMSVKAIWNPGSLDDNFFAQVQLKASTPYISYSGADYEWAGKGIALSATRMETGDLFMSLSPPGGGSLLMTQGQDNAYSLRADGIDIAGFLLPVVNRFALGKTDDTLSFEPAGLANAWLIAEPSGETWKTRGTLDFVNASLKQRDYPNLTVTHATFSIPFCYPLDAKALPRKSLKLTAGTIVWDGASFDRADIVIPISEETITLATNASLPAFGGRIEVQELQITNWQTAAPQVTGRIQLDRLDLEKVSRFSPLVPAVGIISGAIDRIEASPEAFEFSGQLHIDAFGGRMTVNNIFLRPSFGGSFVAGFDIELENIDLKPFTKYFNFGSMTGSVSGFMKNVEVYLPPAGSDELPIPIRMNVEVKSVMQSTGKISRETLEKIYELGEDGGFAMSAAQKRIKEFDYGQLGLKVTLEGNELRLIGALDDYFFISHAKKLFANSIGIRLPDSNKTLSFKDFWQNLLVLTKRFPAEK